MSGDAANPRVPATRPVAWITGASRGLGLRLAERLRDEYDLALGHFQSPPPAIAGALAVPGDVGDPETSRRGAEAIMARFGRLDLFVANAAVIADGPMIRMSEAEWDRVVAVNLTGVFHGLRAAAPLLTKSRGAAVLVSSILGRRGGIGSVNYAAAKAGVMGLAVAAARELAPAVRVNVVCPGYLETEMGLATPQALERARRDHLMGSLSSIDDAARLIREVGRLEAVTGQVFAADGRLVPW